MKKNTLLGLVVVAAVSLLVVANLTTTTALTTVAGASCELGDYAPTHYDNIMAGDRFGQNIAGSDYFQLAVSWSPNYCEQSRERLAREAGQQAQIIEQKRSLQCESGNAFGYVIHGLWGQKQGARDIADHPRYCKGDLPQLPYSVIKPYLCDSPSAHLLQGQWEKHGACDFDSATDYFAKQQQLYDSLIFPQDYQRDIVGWMKRNNPQLKPYWLGFNKGSRELFICYTRDFKLRDCARGR